MVLCLVCFSHIINWNEVAKVAGQLFWRYFISFWSHKGMAKASQFVMHSDFRITSVKFYNIFILSICSFVDLNLVQRIKIFGARKICVRSDECECCCFLPSDQSHWLCWNQSVTFLETIPTPSFKLRSVLVSKTASTILLSHTCVNLSSVRPRTVVGLNATKTISDSGYTRHVFYHHQKSQL